MMGKRACHVTRVMSPVCDAVVKSCEGPVMTRKSLRFFAGVGEVTSFLLFFFFSLSLPYWFLGQNAPAGSSGSCHVTPVV